MVALLFLLSVCSNGFFLLQLLPKNTERLIKYSFIFAFGSFFSISFLYLLSSYVFHQLAIPLLGYAALSGAIFVLNYRRLVQLNARKIFLNRQTLLFGPFLLFSWYLFSKTFGYNNGQFLVASNLYQDFGAHIPFIRSFSHGSNFPPEVSFFGGAGLLYYFAFDFYAGVLEFLHMRIDIAYNLISTISFACLLSTIYVLGKTIFTKSRVVGVLSVVFFLFSSNLSFITFFHRFGLNTKFIFAIWHNNLFYEGLPFPYTTIPLAGFWNLNPFTNQRHLVFGMLIVLLFVYFLVLIYRKKENLNASSLFFLGVSFGLLSLWHITMFLSLFLLLCGFFMFCQPARKKIALITAIGIAIALPEFLAIALHSHNKIVFSPGFLISDSVTIGSFLLFWGINLGLSFIIGILGFLLAKKNEQKLFGIFFLLFLIPNIFHISSRYPFDDHKFFSLWIIFFNFFSAFFIWRLWNKKLLGKVLATLCIFFLTLSGIISFFVIKNDVMAVVPDYPNNAFLSWSLTHLPSNQTIFTNGDIYDPLSLLGKKIFLGRPYYIYLYGGDYSKRLSEQNVLFKGENKKKIAKILTIEHLRYVVLYKNNFTPNAHHVNSLFYRDHFKRLYEDSDAIVFDTQQKATGTLGHSVFQR